MVESFDIITKDSTPKQCRFWGSARMTYTIIAFISMCLHLCMRNTINFVILCMVKPPTSLVNVSSSDEYISSCTSNETYSYIQKVGNISWSRSQQIYLLGAFYYGYVVTLPVAGFLADKFRGKLLFVHSITIQAIVYMLLPTCANFNYYWAVAVRVFQGLIAGCSNPAIYQLFSTWAHSTERTALLSFAYGGYSVGVLLTFPLSSLFCNIGWIYAFYIIGGVSLIFGISCNWLVYSTLESHPRLSREEYEYLKVTKDRNSQIAQIPWKSILSSIPVYAFVLTHVFHTYGLLVFTLMMPRFLKEAMGFSLSETGIYSSVLFLGAAISKFITIFIGNIIERDSKINPTLFRRKLYISCNAITVLFITGIILSNCQQRIFVIIYSFCIGIFTDIAFTGAYWPSLLFIAPSYSGLLSGMANCLATCSGFFAPIIFTSIVKSGTNQEWEYSLLTIILTYSAGAIIFGVFGSFKLQHWDKTKTITDNINMQ